MKRYEAIFKNFRFSFEANDGETALRIINQYRIDSGLLGEPFKLVQIGL